MARYKNKKTGNEIDITGRLIGADWQEVKPANLTDNTKEKVAPVQRRKAKRTEE